MREIDLHTELNALGMRWEPIGFVKAPAYPYGVYVDDASVDPADTPDGPAVIAHEVTLELYAEDMDALTAAAPAVDAWLRGLPVHYRREPRYVVDEGHYGMIYTFTYRAKERIG